MKQELHLSACDVPSFLKYNPHIAGGFRKQSSWLRCLRSVFEFHNETGNIWSHLMPLIGCIWFWCNEFSSQTSEMSNGQLYILLLSICSVIVFAGSVSYHTFMAAVHTADAYNLLMLVDVLGIGVLQVYQMYTIIAFSFPCASDTFHLLLPSLTACFAFYLLIKAEKASDRGKAFGLIALVRWGVILARLCASLAPAATVLHFLSAEVSLLVGGAINVLRVPEIFGRGRFDMLLNSHQIMHIFAVLAIFIAHIALHNDVEWAYQHEAGVVERLCAASPQ